MDVLTTCDRRLNSKVVVAHQPNFMPWAGFFYKMMYADCFVILDEVQFTKGGYTNRVKIRQSDTAVWLTVPVIVPNSHSLIKDVEIRPGSFARKHLNTLRQNYARSKYLEPVMELISSAYSAEYERLVELNLHLLRSMVAFAGIQCEFVLQSDLVTDGRNNEMLASLASQLSATVYVAGQGAHSYMAGCESAYTERGIDIGYHTFAMPRYHQVQGDFVPGCSLIDAMFNLGPEILEILTLQQEPPYSRTPGSVKAA